MNNPPTHSIRGIQATTANTFQANSGQILFRINQGTNGVSLQISVNDTDMIGTNLNMTINVTITTTVSASGYGYASLVLSNSETGLVDVINNDNNLIYLSGTLTNIQNAIGRASVRWTPLEALIFRVTVMAYDNGNVGAPGPLWTMSRTEFRTTPTGV